MRVQAKVAMVAGEDEIFADDLAESMVDQVTKDGWLVVSSEREGQDVIWLIIEKDLYFEPQPWKNYEPKTQ